MRMNELESTLFVQRLFQAFTLGFAISSGQVDSAGDSKNLFTDVLVYMAIGKRQRSSNHLAAAGTCSLFDKERHTRIGCCNTFDNALRRIDLNFVKGISV